MTKQKINIVDEVTARIIAALERGVAPWVKPWRTSGAGMPVNIKSGKPYRGMNVMALELTNLEQGYKSPVWGTFKQYKALGGSVRRGEHGTRIVFWKFGERTKTDSNGDEYSSKYAFARAYTVFNLEQTENVNVPKRFIVEDNDDDAGLDGSQRIAAVDAFANATGIRWSEIGEQACYVPSTDEVRMPAFETFESPDKYAVTLLHELTHATGHKSRLDRLSKRDAPNAYAWEELVAESGAAMLSAVLHVDVDELDHHASYLAAWLKALEDDKRYLLSAFSAAQKAVDWLCKAAGLEDEHDDDDEALAA